MDHPDLDRHTAGRHQTRCWKSHLALAVSATAMALSSQTKSQPATATLHFTNRQWSQVVQTAGRQNKYIFVDISASWCPPCQQLKKESFSNQTVADYYNTHFINYTVDAETESGIQRAAAWNIISYPTLLYFTPSGKMVLRQAGFTDSAALLKLGQQALQRK